MSFRVSEVLSRAVPRVVYSSDLPSVTKTSFASEADINVIVGRFMKTGLLPTTATPPSYLDTTAVPVGSDALMAVRAAQMAFEALPVSLRRSIEHDPSKLEPWLRDPANFDQAVKLGLVVPRASGTPAPQGGGAGSSGGAGDWSPAKVVLDSDKKST